jgi:hypothetical protein
MEEAAGVEHVGRARRATPTCLKTTPTLTERSEGNGGGGIRTRVREKIPVRLYMRIRFFFLVPGVRKRLKTAGHQTR